MISGTNSLSSDESADLVEAIVLTSMSNAIGMAEIEKIVNSFQPRIGIRLDSALAAIKRREMLLGSSYPIEVLPSAFKKRGQWAHLWYTSFLPMSPNSVFRSQMKIDDIQVCAEIFERSATVAIRELLGGSAEAMRFAWPSESGRPQEFSDAIRWLSEKMGLRVGAGFRPPRRKDGGVDVVAWRPFIDGRSAFPVILAQCTIQADVLTKSLDIDLRSWSNWLMLLRDPATVLTVPFVLTASSEDWNEVSQRHVILDRFRLVELLQDSGVKPSEIEGLDRFQASQFAMAENAIFGDS